jgi:hypothetical protein
MARYLLECNGLWESLRLYAVTNQRRASVDFHSSRKHWCSSRPDPGESASCFPATKPDHDDAAPGQDKDETSVLRNEAMAKKKWIQSAIKHPGALKAAAARAGEGTMTFAREHAHSPGKTGQRSRMAITLSHMRKKRKHGASSMMPKKDANGYY